MVPVSLSAAEHTGPFDLGNSHARRSPWSAGTRPRFSCTVAHSTTSNTRGVRNSPACSPAASYPVPYTHFQSQRECVLKPRVARDELPWAGRIGDSQPQGVADDLVTRRLGHNPFRVVC